MTTESSRRRDSDLAALVEHLDALEGAGRRVPCRAGSVTSTAIWTSDDPVEQEVAAQRCAGCPALASCGAFGLAHPRELGVWGGRTAHARRRRPRFDPSVAA
ncbi:transcription factor WhiB [Sediminihabitans luteus]|uniref:Transcription factor WhiB n=1 Tax=Sediminihabitans luteus TaxID=1138585 RepID=A0A2M9D1C5_9CELL|nr:WhiB family transcriptional regulator [Sediminihabitans luteus]PJJ77937.1 transcription factor WhiB [Sediminihabitans luteus]GII99705.1 hypothetical protein Slu03_20830 [Sediminihabitans luteus]